MKPIIITLNKEGKVELTLEKFESIIEEVYNEGLQNGAKLNNYFHINPTDPITPIITCTCTDNTSDTTDKTTTIENEFSIDFVLDLLGG